ncbi:MAG: MFS transporter [Elainellaceae cyanobacterium]
MLQTVGGMSWEVATSGVSLLSQVIVEPDLSSVEDASFVFSGPQFFIALIAGVVLAFAFQFLLTNLGVAAGISAMGGSSNHDDHHAKHSHHDSVGTTIRKIGLAVGLGTLISVTIALFCATLLAVKLSLLLSPGLGAIVGLVIWAAYFSLLVWVSSTTVGSLVGSVVDTATSGFQALFGTAAATLRKGAEAQAAVATVEAAAAAIRREVSGIDPTYVREQVEDYVHTLRSPDLDMQAIRAEFENMLRESSVDELAASGDVPPLGRQAFVDLVRSRSDLSDREVNRIADQLYSTWNRSVNRRRTGGALSNLTEYVKLATSEQLTGQEFNQKLDELIGELRQNRMQDQNQQDQQDGGGGNPLTHALSTTLNSLAGIVIGRTDLSDFDVETIMGRIRETRRQAAKQAGAIADQFSDTERGYSAIQADIENYLLNTYHWRMTPDRVAREFRDVIYDPEADPEVVYRELDQFSRADFADLLRQRGVFTQEEIHALVDVLERVRIEALSVAQMAMERQVIISMLAEVEDYLKNTPQGDLTPEKIQVNLKPILRDSNANFDELSARLSRLDRPFFERVLQERKDLTETEIGFVVMQLETVRDEVLKEAQDNQEAVKSRASDQWRRVQAFLRDTGRHELNPDAIEQEMKLLLHDPQAGAAALRTRASHFNRETLVQVLNQRQDLSESEINDIIDRVERRWTQIRHTPRQVTYQAQKQYDQAMASLAEYLRNTNRDELNPDGIRQDLKLLLDNPQLGITAFRHRLAEVDRQTLVKLLSQRRDLSEEQVNQIVDSILDTLRGIARAPRRLAHRTQSRVQSFQDSIAEYLRSTDKDELDPAGIQRDMRLLLNDPRAGAESLRDRLSQFDRTTLEALLAQRSDMTEAEARNTVDQILSVRDDALNQVRYVQQRVQAAIDRLFAQVRAYLNSLERPELNYDGIKRDVRTLFDDPQAGFDALRDRLSQFNEETLIALISSNPNVSEADVRHVVAQIERARNSVLQQAERIQREAQHRVELVKQDTQRRMDETRKAAAAASWWLFLTAVVSAIAAAGGGALGVAG